MSLKGVIDFRNQSTSQRVRVLAISPHPHLPLSCEHPSSCLRTAEGKFLGQDSRGGPSLRFRAGSPRAPNPSPPHSCFLDAPVSKIPGNQSWQGLGTPSPSPAPPLPRGVSGGSCRRPKSTTLVLIVIIVSGAEPGSEPRNITFQRNCLSRSHKGESESLTCLVA